MKVIKICKDEETYVREVGPLIKIAITLKYLVANFETFVANCYK